MAKNILIPSWPSQAGIDLIKRHEGLRLKAYPDPGTGGVPWTIGYGHTADVVPGEIITEEEADKFLQKDIREVVRVLQHSVTMPLTSPQFDALVSFVFNVGAVQFSNSTLLRKLNAGDYEAIPAQLARWNKAGGNVMLGLVRRRKDEAELWASESHDVVGDHPLPKPEAPAPKALMKSRTLQGAAAVSVGTAGGVIQETVQQLAPAADTFNWIRVVCAILIIVGVVLTVYGRVRIMRDEGV